MRSFSLTLPLTPLIGLCLFSCKSLKWEDDAEFGRPEGEVLEKAEMVDTPVEEESFETPEFVDPGGDLGLSALTQLALANSPVFAEAEGNLRVAEARRKIIGEWRDPEVRSAFSWDDVRVREVREPGNNDEVRRQEAFDASVRFYPPNPLETRAELVKAMAEITYAEFYLRQIGRDIVNEVRRLYQELQFLRENINMGQGLYRLEQDEHQRLDKLLAEGLPRDIVDRQRLAMIRKSDPAGAAKIRFQKTRADLAALAGISNASRIQVRGVPNRPLVGFRDDTLQSLTEIAFINNLKLADLQRLQQIADGDLKAFNARKIPWVSFLEIGRDRTFRDHLPVKDNWSARIAFNVPIFSFFSKEGQVYKEQIRSYQKQGERYRRQVERHIASTVSNIKETRNAIGKFDSETQNIINAMREIETELEPDPMRQANIAHERRVTALGRSRDRLAAEQAYHDALLDLEEIIRDDIEAVFNQ